MEIINEKASLDELEKRQPQCVCHRRGLLVWLTSLHSVYQKIMLFIALSGLLLWQCGAFTIAPPIDTRQAGSIPSYVLQYAPLVWLDTQEIYFPSDMYAQIINTNPDVNYTTITTAPSPLTLLNLDALNAYGNDGEFVYLTSKVDITTNPAWLDGVVPDGKGLTANATSAAVIVNNHGSGLVDAFYMYFYAYNQGNKFLGSELGDHVGDWEHNMVRFQDGIPQALWYSQHGNGEAFTYDCVEKMGIRPISYSARGTHANYAIAGTHDHTIPDFNTYFGLLVDYTSQGILWDPTLSAYFYTWDVAASNFTSATSIGVDGNPLGAMNYLGRWGDEQYPDSDPRQVDFLGLHLEYKYMAGPTGPYDKQLNRTDVCPVDGVPCILRTKLGP